MARGEQYVWFLSRSGHSDYDHRHSDISGIFVSKSAGGSCTGHCHDIGTLSFLVTTPEVWVPDLGSGEHGFPLLTGAGRLVIKDTAILAGAIVVLSDSAKRVLNQLRK